MDKMISFGSCTDIVYSHCPLYFVFSLSLVLCILTVFVLCILIVLVLCVLTVFVLCTLTVFVLCVLTVFVLCTLTVFVYYKVVKSYVTVT